MRTYIIALLLAACASPARLFVLPQNVHVEQIHQTQPVEATTQAPLLIATTLPPIMTDHPMDAASQQAIPVNKLRLVHVKNQIRRLAEQSRWNQPMSTFDSLQDIPVTKVDAEKVAEELKVPKSLRKTFVAMLPRIIEAATATVNKGTQSILALMERWRGKLSGNAQKPESKVFDSQPLSNNNAPIPQVPPESNILNLQLLPENVSGAPLTPTAGTPVAVVVAGPTSTLASVDPTPSLTNSLRHSEPTELEPELANNLVVPADTPQATPIKTNDQMAATEVTPTNTTLISILATDGELKKHAAENEELLQTVDAEHLDFIIRRVFGAAAPLVAASGILLASDFAQLLSFVNDAKTRHLPFSEWVPQAKHILESNIRYNAVALAEVGAKLMRDQLVSAVEVYKSQRIFSAFGLQLLIGKHPEQQLRTIADTWTKHMTNYLRTALDAQLPAELRTPPRVAASSVPSTMELSQQEQEEFVPL